MEILSEATIPEHEFERTLSRTLQSVKVEQKKNTYLVSEHFSKLCFGPTHPYRTGLDPELIGSITSGQLRDFYSRNYTLRDSQIFIGGAIDDSELTWLKERLASLPAPDTVASDHIILDSTPQGTYTVAGANAMQSAIRCGFSIPQPSNDSYFALALLNEILGGFFGSRLMKNLREDKGYTYGVHSSLVPREHATNLIITTEVIAEQIQDAINQIHSEIKHLSETEIPLAELQLAKNSLLGKLANEHATPFDQLEWYKFIIQYHLGPAYTKEYVNSINALSSADLLGTAQQYLSAPPLLTYTT